MSNWLRFSASGSACRHLGQPSNKYPWHAYLEICQKEEKKKREKAEKEFKVLPLFQASFQIFLVGAVSALCSHFRHSFCSVRSDKTLNVNKMTFLRNVVFSERCFLEIPLVHLTHTTTHDHLVWGAYFHKKLGGGARTKVSTIRACTCLRLLVHTVSLNFGLY